MLRLEPWINLQTGLPLAGTSVINGIGKTVALFCRPIAGPGWVAMQTERYRRDPSLVAAVEHLTGYTVRKYERTPARNWRGRPCFRYRLIEESREVRS